MCVPPCCVITPPSSVSHPTQFPLIETLFVAPPPPPATPTHTPHIQDIIFARARTMGIHEMHFTMAGPSRKRLVMIDVGGQKSERRKWIHCFQDVTAILFLVSLSGYDQCLIEERNAVRASLLAAARLASPSAPPLARTRSGDSRRRRREEGIVLSLIWLDRTK